MVASLEALEKDGDEVSKGQDEDSTEDATIKAASALVEDLESDAASDLTEEEDDEEDRDALLAEGAEILVDYLSLRQTAAVSAP